MEINRPDVCNSSLTSREARQGNSWVRGALRGIGEHPFRMEHHIVYQGKREKLQILRKSRVPENAIVAGRPDI